MNTRERIECFKNEWDKIEDANTYPHHLRNINIVDASEFVSKVRQASEHDIKQLVDSIYSGDAYILKNAFSSEFIDNLKQKVFNWSLKTPEGYHEMRDGCPDYHAISNASRGPAGGYVSLEHSYVFFRHNNSLNIFDIFDTYWETIKMLSGNEIDAYKTNIPSDGIIDRITLLQYPIGFGKITKHYDSSKSQKLLLGNLLSQIGEDYDYGKNGFYLVDKNKNNVYIENIANKGDFVCVYPTMYHGVPTVKKTNHPDEVSWTNTSGRWYLQCYSAESHEVEDREYTVAIGGNNG
jgi:hypothetical protein